MAIIELNKKELFLLNYDELLLKKDSFLIHYMEDNYKQF
jgi:hypothetical protein